MMIKGFLSYIVLTTDTWLHGHTCKDSYAIHEADTLSHFSSLTTLTWFSKFNIIHTCGQ